MSNDKTLEMSTGSGFHQVELEQPEVPLSLDVPARLYYEGFYPMVDLIYQSITSGKTIDLLPTFEDGHKVQSVLDAVFELSEHKGLVEVNYDCLREES